MMEKTRIPSGSRRRRPIGNFFLRLVRRHPTSLFVVQMMMVQSRSSAESTSEAIRDNELDHRAATPLAASKRILTMTLIC